MTEQMPVQTVTPDRYPPNREVNGDDVLRGQRGPGRPGRGVRLGRLLHDIAAVTAALARLHWMARRGWPGAANPLPGPGMPEIPQRANGPSTASTGAQAPGVRAGALTPPEATRAFGEHPPSCAGLVDKALLTVYPTTEGRPWTLDRRNADGSATITVKRACNGCHELLGDVTLAEIEAGMNGKPLPDVRAECPTCRDKKANDDGTDDT